MIDNKGLADLLRVQYLSLGLPGDTNDDSGSIMGSGGNSTFGSLLSTLLATNNSDMNSSDTNTNVLQELMGGDTLTNTGMQLPGASQLLPYSIASAMQSLQPTQNVSDIHNNSAKGNYDSIIENTAARYNIPPELIKGVIQQESAFRPFAVSSAGAQGLMQLMPDTARSLGVQNSFDPVQNIEGGTKYLRQLLDRFHGRIDLALAAYNAGPGAVETYGGVPPYTETQAYVQSILQKSGLTEA